jgi:hypothetical protein
VGRQDKRRSALCIDEGRRAVEKKRGRYDNNDENPVTYRKWGKKTSTNTHTYRFAAPQLDDENFTHTSRHGTDAVHLVRDEDDRIPRCGKASRDQRPVFLQSAKIAAVKVNRGIGEHNVYRKKTSTVEVRRVRKRTTWGDNVVLRAADRKLTSVDTSEHTPPSG